MFGVDLGKEYYVNGFMLAEHSGGDFAYQDDAADQSDWFHDYFVHVGNSPDWIDNPACPGGPFMKLA